MKNGLIERPDGTRIWYLNGKFHRADGPAFEEPDGSREWYLNDKLHRTDGPAIEGPDGRREWWLNDKLHRTDGPAVEEPDGSRKWYLNGKRVNESDFQSFEGSKTESKKTCVGCGVPESKYTQLGKHKTVENIYCCKDCACASLDPKNHGRIPQIEPYEKPSQFDWDPPYFVTG